MSKRVAVIADEPDSYYLIRRFAETMGIRVQQINHVEPDDNLIILDIDTEPDWQILRHLQTDQALAHIPVLLCSWQGAHIDYPDDLCINNHLQKPFLLSDFQAAIEISGTLD